MVSKRLKELKEIRHRYWKDFTTLTRELNRLEKTIDSPKENLCDGFPEGKSIKAKPIYYACEELDKAIRILEAEEKRLS